MDPDRRPICVGYVRRCPTRPDEDEQREILSRWFWNNALRDYDWGGFHSDEPKAPNELHRRGRKQHRATYMWVRPACEKLRENLQTGDLLIACNLEVLCNDVTDALEGLPCFVGRQIRVVLIEDDIELRSEEVKLLRVLRRSWLMSPTKSISKTPPLGMRRDSNKWSPAVKELRYMRWCYRRLVLSPDLAPQDVLETAKNEVIHPRTGRPPAHLSTLQHAANAYHEVVALIQLGSELPRWVQAAQKRGFFDENITEIAYARAAGLDPFPDDKPCVPCHGSQFARSR